MQLLAYTITAEARAVLHAAGGLALLPLFATAEMRAHIDLRALTNLHMGKLSVNIGLTLEYATALKNIDAALKVETPAFVELMAKAAASYVPIIMDVVQDAMALYSSKVPMGTAAGVGATAADLAKALKEASTASAMEHTKECEQSYETERHATVSGAVLGRSRLVFTPNCSHLTFHTWWFTPVGYADGR